MTTIAPSDDVGRERAVDRLNLEPGVTLARWGIVANPRIALAAKG